MHILNANDLFWITAYTYDRIMEVGWKYWADAFAVYFKLLEQTRIQQTNQTFTLDTFLEKFFKWWNKRVSVAKWILKNLWLIDNVVVRDEYGKIKAHYVRVNYLIDGEKVRNACSTYSLSTGAENHPVVSTIGGEMETNALSTKYINAWSTKEKICLPEQETQDNIEEKKEKVPPKERKEKKYCEEFECLRKIYPHWKWRGSKPNSYRKRLSWTEEERQKILDKAKEKRVCCECWIDNKQYSKAFEWYMENERWVDFDLESFVNQLMENKKDKDNVWIKLAKEYWWEDVVQKFVKKYVLTHDTMTLNLH